MSLKRLVRRVAERLGYEVRRKGGFGAVPELTAEDRALMDRAAPFAMANPETLWVMLKAARHVVDAGIPGAIVECGVFRGGSMMAAALALRHRGDAALRDLWLFDTFGGMTRPTEHDTHDGGRPALPEWRQSRRGDVSDWNYASLDEVKRNLESTGYPAERIRYVKGPVEETLRRPENLPEKIAFLRLDTDFYESTAAELDVLYPRLSPNGVLIVDDYGHWSGARKAVDEYLARRGEPLLLLPIDASGARLAIKAGRA